jgi:hypothetical protein
VEAVPDNKRLFVLAIPDTKKTDVNNRRGAFFNDSADVLKPGACSAEVAGGFLGKFPFESLLNLFVDG